MVGPSWLLFVTVIVEPLMGHATWIQTVSADDKMKLAVQRQTSLDEAALDGRMTWSVLGTERKNLHLHLIARRCYVAVFVTATSLIFGYIFLFKQTRQRRVANA